MGNTPKPFISTEAKERIFNEIIGFDETNDAKQNRMKPYNAQKYTANALTKVAIFAVCLLACSGTIYAAHRLLSAGTLASMFGKKKLAKRFEEISDKITTAENDIYRVSFLGVVSGEKLCEYEIEVEGKKSYFVMAIERKDDVQITYEEDLIVTPFIKGIAPWQFNVYSMEGVAEKQIVDGKYVAKLYECK